MKGHIKVGATSLYIEDQGEGVPVVLIHGLTLDCRMWWPQEQVLGHRFRTVTYDVRGFGQSDEPQDHAYRDWEDLRSVLNTLNIASANVVGLSRGGRVALEFARYCPERLLRMVLIDTNPRLTDGPSKSWDCFAPLRKKIDELVRANSEEAAREWLTAEIWRSPHGAVHPQIARIVSDYFRNHSWGTPRRNSDLAMADLQSINTETLVMVGSEDIPEFHNSAQHLYELLPHSTILTVPEAGHMSTVDNPVFANQAIVDFILSSRAALV